MVHGGAWDIPESETARHLAGMEAGLSLGQEMLESGFAALDVVAAVVVSFEASGVFDAGVGSVLTRGGFVEMDAGIMRGKDLAFGAVACLRTCANPIAAAQLVMKRGNGQVCLLVGREAEAWLAAQGPKPVTQESLIHPRERARWEDLVIASGFHPSDTFIPAHGKTPAGPAAPSGTVGCVARDSFGHVAAGTSTGGTPFRPEGRVGDSPLPGCGYYADLRAGASATGWGEAIASAGLSGRAVEAVSQGARPQEVVAHQLERMRSRISNHRGEPAAAGLILLGAEGDGAWGYNTPRMARGGWSASAGAWVLLDSAG